MVPFQLNIQLLDEAINKTGFPTEYNVRKLLEKHGWNWQLQSEFFMSYKE